MKKITTLICLVVLTAMAKAALPGHMFTISGKCSSADNGKIYIRYPNQHYVTIIDSAVVTTGTFEFHGLIAGPVIAQFTITKTENPNLKTPYVYIEPGKMLMGFDFKNWAIVSFSGSKTDEEFRTFASARDRLKKKFGNVVNGASPKDSLALKSYQDSVVLYKENLHQIEFGFIKSYPRSYVIFDLLLTHYRSYTANQLNQIYINLGQAMQQTPGGEYILSKLVQMQRNGANIAPVFSLKDFKTGKFFNLSAAKGKYVVLDFWGSWCVPCVNLMPQLVAEHQKYDSTKVQFVSICFDHQTNQKKSIGLINKLRMEWVNVWADMDARSVNDLPNQYDVHVYPTYVIISPEGKLINKYEGEAGFYLSVKALAALLK